MTTLEDSPQAIQRRRFLQHVGLDFVPLTDAQSAAVDTICTMLPVADSPTIFDSLADIDREAARVELIKLPATRQIERWLVGQPC
jgi:hypothetical protein